jgi:hypothetical protein
LQPIAAPFPPIQSLDDVVQSVFCDGRQPGRECLVGCGLTVPDIANRLDERFLNHVFYGDQPPKVPAQARRKETDETIVMLPQQLLQSGPIAGSRPLD